MPYPKKGRFQNPNSQNTLQKIVKAAEMLFIKGNCYEIDSYMENNGWFFELRDLAAPTQLG